MSYRPYFPRFLTGPDPDRDPDYLRRAQWAYPSICRQEQDRPLRVNYGYGEQVFTVEDALVWAERRADAVLP